MYFHAVRQGLRAVKTLSIYLDKAQACAEARKFDVGILMTARLAPDMGDLIYQVQSACDYAKGAAALLAGRTPPRHADDERTIDDLRARIAKTIAFAEEIAEDEYEGAGDREIRVSYSPAGKVLGGCDYLLQIAIPNIYFHVMAAYGILRHNGVDVGKMDFLEPIDWTDPA